MSDGLPDVIEVHSDDDGVVEIYPREIPVEYRDRPQWLLWDGSNDAPRRPHWRGDFAVSWTNPDDWHTFEDAVRAAQERESWGIGYVFAYGNDDYPRGVYGALDLDGCVDDDGTPKDWLPSLQPFFDRDAYMDYSPSGTGIHVPLAGFEPPDWWTDAAIDEHEGVEAYDSKFFTFTGDTLRGSGESVADTGEWVTEWLKEAYETITGERPWDDDEPTHSAPTPDDDRRDTDSSSGVKNESVEAIERAIDALDARDVADKTIVHDWNDDAGTSDDNRAFYPTWGPNCNGTANIVDKDGWTDTGTDSGSGGPLVMAAIDMDKLSHSGARWKDVHGKLWWDAVDHLRELGFDIPEYEGPRTDSPVASDPDGGDGRNQFHDDETDQPTWEFIQSNYADSETDDKYARHMAALKILGEGHYMTPKDTEEIYEYHAPSGVYERGGKAAINEELARGLGAHYSQFEAREIIGKIRSLTYVDRETFNAGGYEDDYLCVKNGVLNLRTFDLLDHSPEYHFTSGIYAEYDPDAESPKIESFMDDITQREADKLAMYEVLGTTLVPHYKHKLFMVLFGPGNNGKTTFYQLVNALLGEENTSGVNLQKLANNRFAASTLVNKMANIAPDMPSTKITEMGLIKALTGNDPVNTEKKGQDSFDFVNRATLMFGCNEPPVIDERTDAVKERIVPIELPERFTSDPDDGNPMVDRDILSKIATDDELSGLLNKAIDGLKRLRENGDVSLPETPDERLELYEQHSDPIKEFSVKCLTNTSDERYVPKSAVYNAYTTFCERHDYTTRSDSVFFRQLRQTTFNYSDTRRRANDAIDEREWFLTHAAFTDHGTDYAPDYATSGDSTSTSATDDERPEIVPLADATPELGYISLTVEVRSVTRDTPDALTQQGKVSDATGVTDFIVWRHETAEPFDLREGEHYRLTNVKAGYNQNGGPQLELTDITEVESVQPGTGHTAAPARAENQSGLTDVETDGGKQERDSDDDSAPDRDTPDATDEHESQEKLVQLLVDGTHAFNNSSRGARQTQVLDMAERSGYERDRAEHVLSTLLRKGTLHEPHDGYLKET